MPLLRSAPRHSAGTLALASAAACAVYASAARNGYAMDDELILRRNPLVHGLGRVGELLGSAYWPSSSELYRPVTLLSFAGEWALFGDAPGVFHATNVLLHAVVSLLVAGLVLRLGGGRAAAAGAGVLFAVHPVHVEAVANLVGRAEVLATLAVLAACHLYLRPGPRGAGRIAGIALLYVAGLLAKESAVALPALLLVVDALRGRAEGEGERDGPRHGGGSGAGVLALLRRNAGLLAALVAGLAAYLLLRQSVLGGAGAGTDPAPYLRDLSTVDRLATAVRLWPEYLRLMLYPADLSAEWGPDALGPATWGEPLVWVGVLLGIGLAAAAWRSWAGGRWIAAAVLWFAAAVLPVSQVVFPVGVLLAERTLYLPSVALAFLLPPLVHAVRRHPARIRPAMMAAAVVLALLAARTWTRTPSWQSTETVLQQLMRDHPDVWLVEWKAAELLVRAGRPGEALPWYRRAMEKVDANHPGMNVGYASVLLDLGRAEEAEPVLRRTLRIVPEMPQARVDLASVLVQRGRYREALAVLDARGPRADDPRTRALVQHRRALAYDGLGLPDSALAVREAALRGAGGAASGPAWFHYARLLALRGRMDEARAAADSARGRFDPAYHGRITVQPVPPLDEPLLRGWGRLAERLPPAPASASPSAVPPTGDDIGAGGSMPGAAAP
ncbi:MAG TPA: tetratricopeptide repeat protein [Longimicrobium sp.]|nr:tetratricopeptide repeat protein [Longimicrobium sp.]